MTAIKIPINKILSMETLLKLHWLVEQTYSEDKNVKSILVIIHPETFHQLGPLFPDQPGLKFSII